MNALASIRAAPIDFDLGGWTFTIPAMNAADWLLVLAERAPSAVVPGLLHPDDQLRIMRDLLGGHCTPEDVLAAARQVIQVAGGRRWWSVQRLVDSALDPQAWPVLDGQMALEGVDLERITLARFINAIFVLALRGCEKQTDRDRLIWEIEKPPSGHAEEVEGTSEDELLAMLGDQARISGAGGQQMIGRGP